MGSDPATGRPYDPTVVAHFEVTQYDGSSQIQNWAPSAKHGTPQNGASITDTSNWAYYGVGYAVKLDGVDDYVTSQVTPGTDRSFTVSAWVQLKRNSPTSVFVSQDGTLNSGFYLGAGADGRWSFGMPTADGDGSTVDTVTGPAAVPSTSGWTTDWYEWTHLLGVFDAAAHEMRFYVNGTKVGTAPHASAWAAVGGVQIGRGLTAGVPSGFAAAQVDDIRVWQDALPDDKVMDYVILPRMAREDLCSLGFLLHAGGPAEKATAQQGLAGTAADRRRIFGGGPYVIDLMTSAYMTDDDARRDRATDLAQAGQAWHATIDPYPIWDRPIGWDTPPEFGKDIGDFLEDRYYFYSNYRSPPKPFKGSQGLIDSAVAVFKRLEATDPSIGWWLSEQQLRDPGSYFAEDLRIFVEYNGFPAVAPAPGSVEFRREVEALKSRWYACDHTDVMVDRYKVFVGVTQAARDEMRAEMSAVANERNEIVAAELQASLDLRTAMDAMLRAQGEAWVAERLLDWQQYWPSHMDSWRFFGYDDALFDTAKVDLAEAQRRAAEQAEIAKNAALSAKLQADKVIAAQARATDIATANGTPVGRGLAYAQQSAQVAKASAAAAQAAAKATETASFATTSTLADSRAFASLAVVQAKAVQSEFRRAAAVEAADQAAAAAVQAADQADRAKTAADRAATAKVSAEQLEQVALAAAAKAREQRQIAVEAGTATAAARAKAEAAASIARNEAAKVTEASQDVKAFTAEADDAAAKANAAAQEANAAASVAAKAETDASAARAEADAAAAESALLSGQAQAATQAAIGARDAATALVTAADEAIALGTPFQTSDQSAALSIVVANHAKAVGQQQNAIAQATAQSAELAAATAAASAQIADGDAQIAAAAAARAAESSSAAAIWLGEAAASAVQATSDDNAVRAADAHIAALAVQAQADADAAALAANGGSPPPPTDDVWFDPLSRLGETVRDERCRAGHILHIGGPALKERAAAALAGTREDVHNAVASVGWTSFSPLWAAFSEDNDAAIAYATSRSARYSAWESILKPYPIWGEDFLTFDRAQPFDSNIAEFIANRSEEAWHAWDADLRTKPTQAELDRAVAVINERAAAGDQMAALAYNEAWLRSYASADDVRMILQYGGPPKAEPGAGTLEFRSEVEALKARWAGCDYRGPIDPYKVLVDVTAAAHTEWEAELDAQAGPRAEILAAELESTKQAQIASDAMVEAVGQAWIAAQLLKWEKYWREHPDMWEFFNYDDALFGQAASEIQAVKGRIQAQLNIANTAAATARTQADRAAAAQAQATQIAIDSGVPVGRGLAYAQQSAQVAKASAAAAQAAALAAQTSLNAANATAEDSATLWSLATVQAKALQAEFRRAAAEEAAAQAKTAADAAKAQADQAKVQADRAKADMDKAKAAEAKAVTLAADAKTKRQAAEAERAVAASARARAESERAKAAAAEAQAQSQASIADSARAAAQSAAGTADEKRIAAEKAEADAHQARLKAEDAARHADALEARAQALEAEAAAAEGTEAAQEARAAADSARASANIAKSAADSARAAANTATAAAVAARKAATEATGAASRARANAKAADADASAAWAQSSIAHAAAADAIVATEIAARNVREAEKQSAIASAAAAQAKVDARAAMTEATLALMESAITAGRAFATGQAAQAAAGSALAASAAATDAIQLGTPYRDSDSSAGLAVLVGQTAKTLAEQQAAAAAAKAAEAAAAAVLADQLAQQAMADAKAAAEAAARAAADAARAAQAVADARKSAADAAAYAAEAKKADEHTTQLYNQALMDSWMANIAAYDAESDAAVARAAATDAEQDAASARAAASAAEADAAAAQTAANEADADADAAETAAANAQADAQAAQDAAAAAEAAAAEQVKQNPLPGGDDLGYEGAFIRLGPDFEIEVTTDPISCMVYNRPDSFCDVNAVIHMHGTVHYFVKTCVQVDESLFNEHCLDDWVDSEYLDKTYSTVAHIPGPDLIDAGMKVGWDLIKKFSGLKDAQDCGEWLFGTDRDGDMTGCLWIVGMLAAPYVVKALAGFIRSLRAAFLAGRVLETVLQDAVAAGMTGKSLTRLQVFAQALKGQYIKLAEVLETAGKFGPAAVPSDVAHMATGWSRFGGLTREEFMLKWWDFKRGTWNWGKVPPDGIAPGTVASPVVPKAGDRWDRFGSPFGRFFSPSDTPFAQRALPPESMAGTATSATAPGYRRYRWLRDWDPKLGEILESRIAPAFEQPGYGIQYMTPKGISAEWLEANGWIEWVR